MPRARAKHDWQALEQLSRDIAAHSEVLVPHHTKKRLQLFGEALESSVLPSMVSIVLDALELVLINCWVNVYRDGEETTGWHQDHYNLRTPNATATLNINLGATREVALQSVTTGEKWTMTQKNGSSFAFDDGFNATFKHSIPRAKLPAEPRSLRLLITIFAAEAAEPPARVMRDVYNAPVGVPVEVCWGDWQQQSWVPDNELGIGANQLLMSAPLMRGHQRGSANQARAGKGAGKGKKAHKGPRWAGAGEANKAGVVVDAEAHQPNLGIGSGKTRRRRRIRGGGRVQGAWAPPAPRPATDQ